MRNWQFILRELGWRAGLAAFIIFLLWLIGEFKWGEQAIIDHDKQPWAVIEMPTITDSHEPQQPVVTPQIEITEPAHTTEQATRGEAEQVIPTLPPPTVPPEPVGLHGLPFAPEHLDGCDEMMWYAYQFDLPARFEGVGWRESRCRNNVNTYCCWGYWQLYVSLHLQDHRLAPMYAECGIASIEDIFGNEPIKKQRNACGAAAVYAVQGGSAWDAW